MTTGDNQDVAIADKKPFAVLGVNADLDADDANFLFPGVANNPHFPNRRDLLFAEINVPGQNATFFVMVHHAKSRVGGRAVTDPLREGGARDILQILEHDFDERDYIYWATLTTILTIGRSTFSRWGTRMRPGDLKRFRSVSHQPR